MCNLECKVDWGEEEKHLKTIYISKKFVLNKKKESLKERETKELETQTRNKWTK